MHKLKKIILLSSSFVLTSCGNKIQIPDDISQFLFPIKFETAYESVKKIKITNLSTVRDKNDKIIGEDNYVLSVIRGEQENYYYQKVQTYTGELIVYDSQISKLFLTERTISVSYDSSTSLYSLSLKSTGFVDKEHTQKDTHTTVYQYDETSFLRDVDSVLFYTQEVSDTYTGGLYFADYFRRNLQAVDYYSIQNDTFVYSFVDKPYNNNGEEAIVTGEIVMDKIGMMISSSLDGTNDTTGLRFTGAMNVLYNDETGL